MASFEVTPENTKLLFNLIRFAGKEGLHGNYITDNPYMECSYYPESKTLVVVNNSEQQQTTTILTDTHPITVTLEAFDYKIIEM
jgi:beta-D-galactosyl-(1->4)-L-rhamnose phosphorylase